MQAEMIATHDTAIIGVAMMDEKEAREAINLMGADISMSDSYADSFRRRVFDFAEREGWRVLGYSGVAAALRAELSTTYSSSYLSRLLQAAEVERVLELPIGNSVPESVLREVAKAPSPEQQRAAYQAATTNGKPTAKKMQAAVAEFLVPHGDELHQQAIDALLIEAADKGERTGTRLYQQAYDHAAEIHDLALHNKMIALIDRATDTPAPHVDPADRTIPADLAGWHWMSGRTFHLTNGDCTTTAYADPAHAIADARDSLARQQVAPASDRMAYLSQEQADRDLLSTAQANIGIGNIGDARCLLAQVQALTWQRDQLLHTLDRAAALAFLTDQRDRLTRFSVSAMISQATFKDALDHIAALLEATE